MGEYLATTKKAEMLSSQKEKELWLLYKKQGCWKSRQILISSYQPLVYREALNLSRQNGRNLDVIQEGTIGLIEAVEAFDYTRGCLFSTFASYKIKGRILNYLGRQRELVCHETDLLEVSEERDLFYKDVSLENRLLMQEIQEKIKRLPSKERAIIQGFFLQDLPAKDIAKDLAISTSYLYKLQKRGIRRLRAFLASGKNSKKAKKR